MSLTKTITTNSGYDASYWKTTRMDMHLDQKAIWVYIAGYKDKSAFDAGLMPVTTQRISLMENNLVGSCVDDLMTQISTCVGAVECVIAEINTSFDQATIVSTDNI
jgi:hypothetical protein